MMEVLLRFPAIGTIADYKAMPIGERSLYEQFVLLCRVEEAEMSGMKVVKSMLSGKK